MRICADCLAETEGTCSSCGSGDSYGLGPRRVQMTRTKPWRHLHPDAVIVDRRTRWGNPYRLGKVHHLLADRPATVEEIVGLYRARLRDSPETVDKIRTELAGKDLACWCRLDAVCHADVLLHVANGGQP